MNLSQALSHVAAVWGYLRPGSDWRKASRARRAASSSGAVQARAQGGGDPLAVPVGDEPHGWRGPGWTTQVGTMESGQVASTASGRPAGPSQHTISTPLAPPCWPDRAHTWAQKEAPSPSWIQILKPRA